MKIAVAAATFFLVFAAPAAAEEIVLKVTAQEAHTIGRGLAELPYKQVALLLAKLQAQINDQQKAETPPPAPAAPPPKE